MTVDAFRLDPGKISLRQLMFIIITMVISTADIFLPAIVAQQAGRDSWIAVIIATAEALVVAAVAASLSLRFPKLTLVQIFQKVLGSWLGWIMAFIFVTIFCLFLLCIVVGEFGIILKSAFMQKTPLAVFNGLLIVIAAYAVYQGIETIARVTEILMPVGIAVLVLVGLLITPHVDFNKFLPLLDNGVGPVINGAHRLLSFLGEGVVVTMLAPYINSPQKVLGTVSRSMVLLGLLLLVGVLAIAMFGPQETANMTFPALNMVRQIRVGDFLEHLDAVIMTVWVGGIYTKTVVIYYISCIGLAQLFNLRSYKPVIWPLGILVLSASFAWLNNLPAVINYLASAWPAQGLIFEFLIPFVLLITAAARGLRDK
ncbi:spore germination protein KB [Desulfohalotomaculum tongense]|uniref:GerAB/ArcD/ProY family transporter n=1 Tax=Desulforadius tongensis TaxID=1216062 RepID=UPI001958AF93|nr:endospore germination permease [Desulforadius tongensis]MBM7854544.1 spore germination protein KB [Desulforadius tongensis]